MFKDDFVCVIKVGNKVLREQDGIVKLPFGSEYVILLKNLHNTRAAITIKIDDQQVTCGRLVLDPNEECELEGFMEGHHVTHRFKFIEKTEQISEFRGDRAADGILRVEYEFEKTPEVHTHTYHHDHYDHWHNGWNFLSGVRGPVYGSLPYTFNVNSDHLNSQTFSGPPGGSLESINLHDGDSVVNNQKDALDGALFSMSCNVPPVEKNVAKKSVMRGRESLRSKTGEVKDGITVKGSSSDQSFATTYLGQMEGVKRVIALKLMGYTSQFQKVAEPITVQTKLICPTCGQHNRSSSKFCPNCGTSIS